MNLISTKYYLSKFAFGLSLVVVLIFSEDFRANHLLNIDSEEINFRMNFSLPLTEHYYPRWDIETPANVVDRESNKDDVIITNEQICRYYLNRLDYTFKDFKGPDFQGESILNGTKERWTYAKLIYKYSDLNQMIDNSHHRIWLMINTMWALDELDSVITKYQKYLYFTSIDGHILLYKVTK